MAPAPSVSAGRRCGEGQNRTADTAVFSRVLCQLSYLAGDDAPPPEDGGSAVRTGFEPAISALTGRRVNQATPRDPMDFVPPTGFEPVSPP